MRLTDATQRPAGRARLGDMDLSRLPEPLRRKLEARLAQLPDAYREVLEARLAKLPADQFAAVVAKSSPMLDRLEDRLGAAGLPGDAPSPDGIAGASAPVLAPGSSRLDSATVGRGDPPMPPALVVLVLFGGLALLAWWLGWLPA